MPRPDRVTFEELVRTQPFEQVVEEHLFGDAPFAFDAWPEGWPLLRAHLATRFAVPEAGIVLVGSGKLGFSMNPDSYGRQFSSSSDLDLVIVSEVRFDEIWEHLLRWHYPRSQDKLGSEVREWRMDRRRDVFLGRFEPATLVPRGEMFSSLPTGLRDASTLWFDTLRGVGTLDPKLAARDYNGRLYRTWKHALLYHADGLRAIRPHLQAS